MHPTGNEHGQLTGREAFLLSTKVSYADVAEGGDKASQVLLHPWRASAGKSSRSPARPEAPLGCDRESGDTAGTGASPIPQSPIAAPPAQSLEPQAISWMFNFHRAVGEERIQKPPSVLSLGLTLSPTLLHVSLSSSETHFPEPILKDSAPELSLSSTWNPNPHPLSSGSSPPLLHPLVLKTDPAALHAAALS